MTLTGTLRWIDLEGGTWLLVGSDGRQHQLQPPPTGYQSGDRVEITGESDPGGISFRMAAPIFRVRSMRRL